VKKFKGDFTTADGKTAAPKDEPVDSLGDDDVDRDSVKVNRPKPSGGGGGSSSGSSRG
jgi:F-type H+-transporting ATPase subunit alpha